MVNLGVPRPLILRPESTRNGIGVIEWVHDYLNIFILACTMYFCPRRTLHLYDRIQAFVQRIYFHGMNRLINIVVQLAEQKLLLRGYLILPGSALTPGARTLNHGVL